jgi:hypothetical protein
LEERELSIARFAAHSRLFYLLHFGQSVGGSPLGQGVRKLVKMADVINPHSVNRLLVG